MRVTLHQLNVFAAVAANRSVTLAAREMHMTQPAVSNIIKQLQIYYDCSLVEVIGRQLSLTQFGEILYRYCHDIEQSLSSARSEISLLKGGVCGELRVATVTTAKYFVPRLLGQFKQHNTDVHIKLTVCNRQETLDRLQANKDDFVIMSHPPTSAAVDCADFFDDELVVIAHPDFVQQQPPVTSLKALAEAPWIMREPGSGTRYATEAIFARYHFIPHVEMEISDNEAIKQAVMAGMGISVVSRQSVANEVADQQIVILPIKQFPVFHEWYMVKNAGKALSPIAEKFYHFVSQEKS